jgi:succinate dehydrogenase / fumarate reductase, cytochrome b subunit
MSWLRSLYGSTIGKKAVMAVTGVVLVGYLVAHVLGNLLVFRGPEAINSYAELLKSNKALLWGVRGVLLAAVALHIHAAWALTRLARSARPRAYREQVRRAGTFSSVSLRVGGVILLVFIVFHLLHFTTGTLHPAFSPIDVFGNVVIGFGVTAVSAFYLLAMVALGLHLHHGLWSLFQTLGVHHPRLDPARRRAATVLAILIAGGFMTIPLAVLFGLLG